MNLLDRLISAREVSNAKHMSFAYFDGNISITWEELIDAVKAGDKQEQFSKATDISSDTLANGYKKA